MPTLTCPHCSHRLEVAVSRAGTEVPCGACGQSVTVPKLGELRELQSDTSATAGATAGGRDLSTGSPLGPRLVFAALVAAAALASIVAAFALVRFAMIERPTTSAEHIAEIEEVYPQLPGARLVREWQHIEAFRPELANPFYYQIIANEKAAWLRQGLIALGLAVLFAAVAAGIVMARRRRV
jgi:hypothetical protein